MEIKYKINIFISSYRSNHIDIKCLKKLKHVKTLWLEGFHFTNNKNIQLNLPCLKDICLYNNDGDILLRSFGHNKLKMLTYSAFGNTNINLISKFMGLTYLKIVKCAHLNNSIFKILNEKKLTTLSLKDIKHVSYKELNIPSLTKLILCRTYL